MRRGDVKEKCGFQIYMVLAGDGKVRLESVMGWKEGVIETNVDCLACPLFLPC